jgi:hypothetical protein
MPITARKEKERPLQAMTPNSKKKERPLQQAMTPNTKERKEH